MFHVEHYKRKGQEMSNRPFPFDGTYNEDELEHVKAYLESGFWGCLKPDERLERAYERREARRRWIEMD
jgi:hypothetical protein